MFDGYGAKLGDTDAFMGGAEGARDSMGFQGQFGAYTDNETGLVLMGHRYYDAGTGRFLTRDPLGYNGGINLYGFTGNNPVNEIDPEGFKPDPDDPTGLPGDNDGHWNGTTSAPGVNEGFKPGTSQNNMARQMTRDEVGTLRDVGIAVATGGLGTEGEAVEASLSAKQRGILGQLAQSGSEALMHKRAVSMRDLRQLTIHTGDEFAMFTRGSQRLIMRGRGGIVPMTPEQASEMAKAGWRFSGHTHTPGYAPEASEGDREILRAFGQRRSGIWATSGRTKPFYASIADGLMSFLRRL